ncbi:hypothetical protein BKI52_37525 [marine bacterium AO1-C]|nr:hypothetical protein BKI52_37525 [marine bacterium AO1-C]
MSRFSRTLKPTRPASKKNDNSNTHNGRTLAPPQNYLSSFSNEELANGLRRKNEYYNLPQSTIGKALHQGIKPFSRFWDRGGQFYTVNGRKYNNFGHYNPYDGQHTIEPGNTYTGLSRRYYGDSSKTKDFQRLHQELGKKFEPGETILVNFEQEGRHVKLARLNRQNIDLYTPMKGESIYQIANRHKITADLLISMQGNISLHAFYKGDNIRIPLGSGILDLQLTEDTTAEQLAKKYGVPIASIIDFNMKKDAVMVVPGTRFSQRDDAPKKQPKRGSGRSSNQASFGRHKLTPKALDLLLRHTKVKQYVAVKGDNLWKIMHQYWGEYAKFYNERSYYNLVNGLVMAMLEANHLKLNSKDKIDGFMPDSPIFIIVPNRHPNQIDGDRESNNDRGNKKASGKAGRSKILTDKQSADIGTALNYLGGGLAVIDIAREKMGSNNLFDQRLIKLIGVENYNKLKKFFGKGLKVVGTASTIAGFAKFVADIHDGRYEGKPENFFFDVLSLIIGLNPYGAIFNAVVGHLGVDGDAFRKFCQKHGGIQLPKVVHTDVIGTGDHKIIIHTPVTPSEFTNVPPPLPVEVAKKAKGRIFDKIDMSKLIKKKK